MLTTGPEFSFKFKRKTCIQTKLLVQSRIIKRCECRVSNASIVRDSDLPTKIVAILVTSMQAAEMRIQQNQNPSASVSATSKTALLICQETS